MKKKNHHQYLFYYITKTALYCKNIEIPLQTTLQLSHNFCVRVFLHEFQLFFQQCFLGTKLYNWWGKTNQNIHTIKSNNAIIIQSYNQKNKYAKKDVHTIRWKKRRIENWFNAQLTDDMKVNLFFWFLKSARYYQVESTELGFSAIEMKPFEKHRYCLE